MSLPAPRRAARGLVAAIVSALTFHQAAWAALYAVGLMPPPLLRIPLAGYAVRLLLFICLTRAAAGVVFALLLPRLTPPAWRAGLLFGAIVGGVEWLSAYVYGGRWAITPDLARYLMQALVINTAWGFGTGLIYSVPLPRRR